MRKMTCLWVAALGFCTMAFGSDPLDISGYVLTQANSAQTFTLPAGTMIPPSGYVIVARDNGSGGFANFANSANSAGSDNSSNPVGSANPVDSANFTNPAGPSNPAGSTNSGGAAEFDRSCDPNATSGSSGGSDGFSTAAEALSKYSGGRRTTLVRRGKIDRRT